MAIIENGSASVEREPVRADRSLYLKNRLTAKLEAGSLLAHIRLATIGLESYSNTHPFSKRDESGRVWTLIHNGTIFESELLSGYQYKQEGNTDSERILLYIVDQVNRHFLEDFSLFEVNARIALLEDIVKRLSPENKLNLIFSDGEYMYVHKNAADTLFVKHTQNAAIFSTKPLDTGKWEEVPENRLLVYRQGQLLHTGRRHPYAYVEDPEKVKLLFMNYAGL